MLQLVIAHGREPAFDIPAMLERDWEYALRWSLRRHVVAAPWANSIPVHFVFYGDLARPDSLGEWREKLAGDADAAPTSFQIAVTNELLGRAAPLVTKRRDWTSLDALARALDNRFGVGTPVFRHFLTDAERYFADPTPRNETIARLRDGVRAAGGEVALLAHGMGTVVGYELLAGEAELPVRAFITFGSPLGLGAFRRRLGQPPGATPFPHGLPRWINIYNPEDYATAQQRLALLFPANDGRVIEDNPAVAGRPDVLDPLLGDKARVYLGSATMGLAVRSVVDGTPLILPRGTRRSAPSPRPGWAPPAPTPRPAPPPPLTPTMEAPLPTPPAALAPASPAETDRTVIGRVRLGEPKEEPAPAAPPFPPSAPRFPPPPPPRGAGTDESQTNPGLRPPAGALPPLAPPPGPGREGEHLVGAPPNEEADDSPTVFIPRDRNGGSKTRSVSPQPAARPVPWPPYAGGERGEADVAAPPLPPLPPLAVPQFPSPPPPPAARPALSTVTRNTAADFPSRVEPGSENLLQYTISPRALTGHAAQGTLAVAVPADEVTLPLIVSVVASEFDVLDADTGQRRNFQRLTLDLAADAADVTGQFVLRARAVAAPTRSVIHLNFAHRGLPVGEIDLHVEISADPSGAGDRPSGQAGRLDINLDAPPPPDLVLHVNHQPDGKVELWADRTGQYCGRDLGAFPIAGGAEQYAQTILNAFHDAQARRTPALRRLAVAQAGAHLWSQLPRLCRDFYWQELHDRDLSIAIYSDEPYIPWELITPVPDGGGEPAPMLGAAFAIARWKRGVRFPSPLRVRDFAVIAPTYQVNTLQHADAEAQDLIRGYGARRVAGQVEPVTDLLETPGTQAIHFCSHGSFDMAAADNSRIKLEDGPLFPMNIRNVQVGRRDHPMVFLNACGVGGEGWSLTNIGGWGEVFCDAGFSIFVGPYWAVDDAVARIAANLFYARLKAGDTVGQAMRAVRRQFTADLADARACAHPTWIAYTLHSQPNMAVHFGI